MRKHTLYLSVLAAAMSLSTGITAFAGEWQQDSKGWYYVQDDGSWIYGQEFTDPADGAKYFMDPDGYMMTETRVNGFWYGADGRQRDKTEAELAAEEARRQRIASRPSPAREQAAASQAAQTAKSSNIAVSTTRLAYQAEMKALMDIIFIDTYPKVQGTAKGSTTEDNVEVSYRFNTSAGPVLSCSLWKMSNPKNANYKPEALELSYNRGILYDADIVASFNESFSKLLTAALGENRSKAIYDRCLAEEIGNGSRFEETDTSDTGNFYELTYRNNTVTIKITCSEIVPDTTGETDQETASTEEANQETAPEQPATSVIVAGQNALAAANEASQTNDDNETTADDSQADDGSEAGSEAETESEGDAAAES